MPRKFISDYNIYDLNQILARSIGHNLGMSNDFDDKHGGNNGPCNGKGIMSNVASTSYNQWSACSRSDWEHHYASRYWGRSCLDNISGNEIYDLEP